MPPQRSNPQLLLIGGAAALFAALLGLTIALVMIFVLRGDVATLEDQARRSAKATKALQEEIAALRDQAAALAASQRSSAPQPQNIDAADPAGDCVIRPSSKDAFADCKNLGPRQ